MLNSGDTPHCADPAVNPEWWFPEPIARGNIWSESNKETTLNAIEALEICQGCPLMANGKCLEYAMSDTTTIDHGIYAGTFPYERKNAVGKSLTGDSNIFQSKIRNAAAKRGIITPKIATRERPKPSRLDYVPYFISAKEQ